jgi:HAD superfamily hydrolase (TIGR01509 family)
MFRVGLSVRNNDMTQANPVFPAPLEALIFDVDGTLADTEMSHLKAFNEAFKACDLDWHWSVDDYKALLVVSGGKERIRHFWQQKNPDIQILSGGALEDIINRIHELKTAAYEQRVRDGYVEFRPGMLDLIEEASQAGLQMAIATTTSPANIAALMRKQLGSDWRLRFRLIEDASTAPHKKPNPQVYLQTLAGLGLPAANCIAFEDSENGLKAAQAAGLKTIVTPNPFTEHQNFAGALCVLPNLAHIHLADIRALHSGESPHAV